MRVPASGVILLAAVAVAVAAPLGGCNKPTSDNIQLWKTTEKGPEKLHEALADQSRRPQAARRGGGGDGRHRARGRGGHRARRAARPTTGRRSPRRWCPGTRRGWRRRARRRRDGQCARAIGTALFSLRQMLPAQGEDRKRIDAALAGGAGGGVQGRQGAAGAALARQDVDRRSGRDVQRAAGARAAARTRPTRRRPSCWPRWATRRPASGVPRR